MRLDGDELRAQGGDLGGAEAGGGEAVEALGCGIDSGEELGWGRGIAGGGGRGGGGGGCFGGEVGGGEGGGCGQGAVDVDGWFVGERGSFVFCFALAFGVLVCGVGVLGGFWRGWESGFGEAEGGAEGGFWGEEGAGGD